MKRAQKQARNFPSGDKAAFFLGVLLTVSALAFFIWKMSERLTEDASAKPVPTSMQIPPSGKHKLLK